MAGNENSGPKKGRVVDWNTRPEGINTKAKTFKLPFDTVDILDNIRENDGNVTKFVTEAIHEKWEREKAKG